MKIEQRKANSLPVVILLLLLFIALPIAFYDNPLEASPSAPYRSYQNPDEECPVSLGNDSPAVAGLTFLSGLSEPLVRFAQTPCDVFPEMFSSFQKTPNLRC
jgi:hypothetical protein